MGHLLSTNESTSTIADNVAPTTSLKASTRTLKRIIAARSEAPSFPARSHDSDYSCIMDGPDESRIGPYPGEEELLCVYKCIW
ncbi:hypothetical protein L208DRAFT_1384230 [Tricholoma matsutake]|nr:hypothetical protein L208DRAFT_1384230 [Tricholoma matsutake 945]